MPKELDLFLSNSLDVLYENLKASLFASNSQPFAKRLIVVYGPAMKSWLMLKMAQDPDLGIAAGIDFLYLNQAFDQLMDLFHIQTNKYLPTRLELALFIEKEIFSLLNRFSALNETEKNDWLPLIHYLKIESSFQKLSSKAEKRLIGLSQHLAKLFQDYGRFAGHLAAKWDETEPSGWQQRLWKMAFHEQSKWIYLCKALKEPIQANSNYQIHFFSISFLAKCEFDFLIKLSKEIPCYSYLISSCAVFWSDIRSDKESGYLQLFWEKKLGQFSPQLDQLDELLRDRNPLLANFGRMGREMACQIEESPCQTHAYYLLPGSIQNIEDEQLELDDLHLCDTEKPFTLLQAIQADMLLMRNPKDSPPFSIEEEVHSIQLHKAANQRREIEILYHNLIGLMQKHPALEPRDIIVMAPQIFEYVPYIQNQFETQESLIDCQILDLGLHSQSEITQGFLQLIDLSEGRWDANRVLQLFEQASFQRKHQISHEDFYLIRDWVEQAGIRWGDDAAHRNELLKRHHCRHGMLDETPVGTWDYGLARLLLGLTHLLQSNESNPLDINPCHAMDFAEAELLGKWMRLLNALREDLLPLHDGSQMSVEDWSTYFTCLLDSYLQPDFNQAESIEEYTELKGQFDILRSSARTFKDALFSYQSMKTHLLDLLQQGGITYRENYVQSVRFCSLIPLRSIPAKVIVLLGMQEGEFPRPHSSSSLNLIDGRQEIDYSPSPVDYDRYLFLEALHSAKDFLLISYQGYDQKDSKELQPSLVVNELFAYLDRYYTINGMQASNCCIYKHPFDAFDKQYFLSNTPLCSFSMHDFNAALVRYNAEKKPPHRLIEAFKAIDQPLMSVLPNNSLIELKHLCDVARNPIKFHLNRILGIYLQTSDDRSIEIEEPFSLSDLNRSILKKQALEEPLEDVLKNAEKDGKLPFGLFKTIATHRLTHEVDTVLQRLIKEDLSTDHFLEIELCASCKEPMEVSNHSWLCPAVTLIYSENYQLHIVGKLSHVTPKGLFVMSKKKETSGDIWKIWPQFLVYQYAVKMLPMKLERNLIFSGSPKSRSPFFDDPEPYLKQFIEYYALCQRHFSPLLPEWMPHIIKSDIEGLQKEINHTFENAFGGYKSDDLKWVMNKNHLLDAKEMIEQWKTTMEVLLGDLSRWL